MLSILKRLIKGSLTYGFGSLSQKIVGVLLVPVYTRFLTTSDYGIVAVASSVSSILGIFLGMGLSAAVVRHYYDYADSQEEVPEYIGTVFLFFLAVSISIVTGLAVFGKPLFDSLFSDVPFHPYIFLTLWTALFGVTSNILLGLYRAREQAGRYVALQVGQFLVSLGVIIYLVTILQQGALGQIRGGFLSGLLFFFVFLVLTLREGALRFSMPKLRNALGFGLPLMPHMLSGWVLAAADRILLARMTSLSEVGLYNLGYQIGMVMSLVVSAINFAWAPIFYDTARNRKDARSLLSRMFTLYAVVVSTLAVGAVLFSREVILIMAAKPFYGAYLVVPAVAVGYLFQGLYFMSVTPIFYMKKTYVLPCLTGFAALLNIGLNIWWIPRLGIMGAAYATLVAFALLFALTHIAAQRYYRIPYDYRRVVSMGLLVAGVYLVNNAMHFQGIIVPVLIKMGIVAAFLAGVFLLKVVSIQELKKVRELVRGATRHDDQESSNG